MIRSAVAGPTPGKPESVFGVLLFDGRGHFAHRADHGPQRLLHAHAVDRAEQLEELALDLGQKADQPRRQPALHRVAFQIFDRVQADSPRRSWRLQLPARELGNQDFVFERADAQRQRVFGQREQLPVILVIKQLFPIVACGRD